MNKFTWTILIVLLITLVTACVAIFKPQLTVRTFNSVPEKVVQSDFQPAPAPKIRTVNTQSKKTAKTQPVKTKIVEKIVVVQEPAPTKSSKPQSTATSQKTVQKPAQKAVQNVQPAPRTAQSTPKPAKQLTEAEEIIVWNKWHSDLQNQIMQDSKIYSPRGTVFMFSFTVDKNRRVSNIKVWSETTNAQPGDIYRIKTVISSYQNDAILEFPAGTKRIITNFKGGFTVSTDSRYSSPEDYSDVEKVKVKK